MLATWWTFDFFTTGAYRPRASCPARASCWNGGKGETQTHDLGIMGANWVTLIFPTIGGHFN
jgi:hypothetical protein